MDFSIKHLKSECGQALIEFLGAFPLLFLIVLIALYVAAVWYAHNVSAIVALEGASLEGAQSGWGADFVDEVGNGLSANVDFSITIETDADFSHEIVTVGSFQRFTISDDFNIPWAPRGLRGQVSIQGTAYTPVWEFSGGSE